MKPITISVIIPCFNAERYIGQAIESVLQQTLLPEEIIVIDDGSEDQSITVLTAFKQPHVRCIQNQHHGSIAKTRNHGIRCANGSLLAFLDADDVWHPKKLARQVAALHAQPELAGIFGMCQQFISEDMRAEDQKRYAYPTTPQAGYLAGCLLIKRTAFLQVGYFDENLKMGEFIAWVIAAQLKNLRFAMLDQVVLYRRIHGKNTVLKDIHTLHSEYLKIIREKINKHEKSR